MIPPDGGWGWVIAMAYGANNMIMIPVILDFNLVLKDVFENLDFPATDATIILSVNSSFGMCIGLFYGPLFRKFGYRKIAVLGSVIFTIGITMTAYATTFGHFLVTYGMMASIGIGLTTASFSLALTAYFVTKRGQAVGMGKTLAGFGPILMPQLVSYLLSSHGTQSTIIILGGLTLHSLVAALLLQPVKWHAKRQTVEEQNEQLNSINEPKNRESLGNKEIYITVESANEARERRSSMNIDNNGRKSNGTDNRRSETLSNETDHSDSAEQISPTTWWSCGTSIESLNFGSTSVIFDENVIFGPMVIEEDYEKKKKSLTELPIVTSREMSSGVDKPLSKATPMNPGVLEESTVEKTNDSCLMKVLRSIVSFFDFHLLRDPIYVNIILGTSITLFADVNFSILTPFILGDMGFSKEKITAFMSSVAGVDLISRASVPFIGGWIKQSARRMTLLSLFLMICFRTMLIFTETFVMLIVLAIGLGFAKGIRSVYMGLVLANYIPIERLPSAMGIQTVLSGLVLMMLGPLLGWFSDKLKSYVPSLILMNSMTALAIIMWVTEMCIVHEKTKKRARKHRYGRQVDV